MEMLCQPQLFLVWGGVIWGGGILGSLITRQDVSWSRYQTRERESRFPRDIVMQMVPRDQICVPFGQIRLQPTFSDFIFMPLDFSSCELWLCWRATFCSRSNYFLVKSKVFVIKPSKLYLLTVHVYCNQTLYAMVC